MMSFTEETRTFSCGESRVVAILHRPQTPVKRGVLVVVGGPQYRVGSHRQFVLLARTLAQTGIPVMRFDYRGMGDSPGGRRSFEDIEEDMRSAIDEFFAWMPGLKELIIWGLCDAVSAALLYAYKDPRVTGLIMLNPWVRTEESMAKAYVKHYYLSRLFSKALWRKIFKGRFNIIESSRSFLGMLVKTFSFGNGEKANKSQHRNHMLIDPALPLPRRMALGFEHFTGRALFILSGDDLTAAEFKDLIASSEHWKKLMQRDTVSRKDLPEANHTFSTRRWRDQVATWSVEWIQSW